MGTVSLSDVPDRVWLMSGMYPVGVFKMDSYGHGAETGDMRPGQLKRLSDLRSRGKIMSMGEGILSTWCVCCYG